MDAGPVPGTTGVRVRLCAAGVGYEDHQDLLGHRSDRITTHYSAPDVARLVEAAERACDGRTRCSESLLTQMAHNGKSKPQRCERAAYN